MVMNRLNKILLGKILLGAGVSALLSLQAYAYSSASRVVQDMRDVVDQMKQLQLKDEIGIAEFRGREKYICDQKFEGCEYSAIHAPTEVSGIYGQLSEILGDTPEHWKAEADHCNPFYKYEEEAGFQECPARNLVLALGGMILCQQELATCYQPVREEIESRRNEKKAEMDNLMSSVICRNDISSKVGITYSGLGHLRDEYCKL